MAVQLDVRPWFNACKVKQFPLWSSIKLHMAARLRSYLRKYVVSYSILLHSKCLLQSHGSTFSFWIRIARQKQQKIIVSVLYVRAYQSWASTGERIHSISLNKGLSNCLRALCHQTASWPKRTLTTWQFEGERAALRSLGWDLFSAEKTGATWKGEQCLEATAL